MNFHPLAKWEHSTLHCPQCGSHDDKYRWHERCRKLKTRHFHTKCWKCGYEWAAPGKAG